MRTGMQLVEFGPRERAAELGVASLGDAELVAVLLGTGMAGQPVAQVAAALLQTLGGLEGIARLGPHAIAAHPGLGLAKAVRIAAALELGKRLTQRAARPREPLKSSAAVAALFAPSSPPSITKRCGWSRSTDATACAAPVA